MKNSLWFMILFVLINTIAAIGIDSTINASIDYRLWIQIMPIATVLVGFITFASCEE